MPRRVRVRVPTTELEPSGKVFPALADAGFVGDDALALVIRAASRLRRALRLSSAGSGPISTDARTVKVENVAGVIRLAPRVELEVAPKFLGVDHLGWREDLLAIANYTGEGGLLSENVRAETGKTGDLASMIARSFVAEFASHRRKPLRLYRQRRWRDFQLDGELDADISWEQSPDGFAQQAIVLDLQNPFNAVIAAAATVLVAEVGDTSLRAQLLNVRAHLGSQSAPRPDNLPRLPTRCGPWADLLELSRTIVKGGDLVLAAGQFEAPGFIVRTWEAWEQLTYRALRAGLGATAVKHHRSYVWATRADRKLRVYPDVSLVDSEPHRLVDAKYKTRLEDGVRAIAQSDLMECAAFMGAAETERIVLVYPRSGSTQRWDCGVSQVFDVVTVAPGRQIVGVETEVRGFSAHKGHREFSANLTASIEDAFARSNLSPGDCLAPMLV